MRVVGLLTLIVGLLACEDAPSSRPDAGPGSDAETPKDSGLPSPGSLLDRGQLHPEVEEVISGDRVLRARMGAHAVETASSGVYRLRGGFRPLSP